MDELSCVKSWNKQNINTEYIQLFCTLKIGTAHSIEKIPEEYALRFTWDIFVGAPMSSRNLFRDQVMRHLTDVRRVLEYCKNYLNSPMFCWCVLKVFEAIKS